MCSSMKQPKPDRLVETDGIPMTVHSADGETTVKNIVGGCWIIVWWIIIIIIYIIIIVIVTWCVAPRLIVRGEDSKVTTSYKVLIIHWKQRRGGWKKLGMEDNLKAEKEIVMSHKSWKCKNPQAKWRCNSRCLGCVWRVWHTLTRSAELLKRPMRRTQFRMGSLASSSMLCVQMGGWHCLWVAKMARFIMVKSSLSSILDTSGSCPLIDTVWFRQFKSFNMEKWHY